MRPVSILLLVISTTCLAWARPRISGYCEQGGQVVVTSGVQSVTKVQQSYPSCTLTVYYTGGATGTVTTNGTAVTLVSGPPFGNWAGLTIQINSIPYIVQSVTDPAHLTLTGSAGPQTAVTFVAAQPTPAPIYSDNNGTPLAGNSFNASGTGYWFFYANNGTYDVKMSGGGIPQPFTWGAISAFDPLNPYFPTLTVYGPTTLSGPTILNGTTTLTGPIVGGSDITISAAQPLYLYSHFRDDDTTHLRLSYSRDGINYTDVNSTGVFTATSFRDPSVLYVPNAASPTTAGTTYFLATPSTGCQIQFISTQDDINFTVGPTINMAAYASGCQTAWAPEWWQDPNGNYYFWVSVGTVSSPTYNSPKTPWLIQFNPATGAVIGTPSPVVLNGTTQGNTFDYFPYLYNGTYYLFYVDQQNNPTVTQPIAYATSSALGGPYSQVTAPGVDYFGFGTFQTEAPAIFTLGNTGCVQVMVDEWTYPLGNVPVEPIGRAYTQAYRTSCAFAGPLFSPGSLVSGPSPIVISSSEHGTVLPLTTSLAASVVYNAAAKNQASSNVAGNFCVNIQQCPYLFTAMALPSFAGGVTTQQPATIGFGYGNGAWASLTAMHQATQQAWPPVGATNTRIAQGYNGDGGFGQFQIINLNQVNGEASVLFCDGCWQAGATPVSTQGPSSIWTSGENNQAFTGPDASHRFHIFNAGYTLGGGIFGGFPLSASSTTGGVLLPWGLNLGIGNGSAYDTTNWANIDSWGSSSVVYPNGGKRVNCGDGLAFGNRNCNFAAGSVNVQNYIAQSGGSNTDLSGFLVIQGGGSATRTFTIGTAGTYSGQPLCTGSDATAANAIRVFTSTSGSNYILNIIGTPGDTVNYICVARSY